jgi:hypothetical protein
VAGNKTVQDEAENMKFKKKGNEEHQCHRIVCPQDLPPNILALQPAPYPHKSK